MYNKKNSFHPQPVTAVTNCKKAKSSEPISPAISSTSDLEEDKIITRFKKNAPMCGICYLPIEKQGSLDICDHEFCFKCIETWAKTENTCPMCKKRFSKIKNVWKRPYYGENARKKLCTPATKSKIEETPNQEIEIPTRNQSTFDGVLTVERLLNFLIAIFPLDSENVMGRSHIFSVPSNNENHEISIEIMLHNANEPLATIPITLTSVNSAQNSDN